MDSNEGFDIDSLSNRGTNGKVMIPIHPASGLGRPALGTVLSIHNGQLSRLIKNMFIESVLLKGSGQQRLFPTPFFFNDEGLQIWSDITRTPTYPQTNEEIELLIEHGANIASHIAPGSTLLDIGASDVRKVQPLLDALEASRTAVQYFAVDLSKEALERGMELLIPRYQFVKCFGLWGTFIDAMNWCRTLYGPICVLSLGSFFGNDHFDQAVARLSIWRDIMRYDDQMLLGLDGCMSKTALWNGYHDPSGLFERFLRNGLQNSNKVLGYNWYREEDWSIEGILQEEPLMHKYQFRAQKTVVCEELGLRFDSGDVIDCFEVFKYGPSAMLAQFHAAGFHQKAMWKSPVAPNSFYDYLLSPAR